MPTAVRRTLSTTQNSRARTRRDTKSTTSWSPTNSKAACLTIEGLAGEAWTGSFPASPPPADTRSTEIPGTDRNVCPTSFLWINENVPSWKTVWVGPTNKSALKVILEENEGYPLPPHPMHED